MTLNIVQVFSGIVFYEHVAIGAVLFVLGGLGVVFNVNVNRVDVVGYFFFLMGLLHARTKEFNYVVTSKRHIRLLSGHHEMYCSERRNPCAHTL